MPAKVGFLKTFKEFIAEGINDSGKFHAIFMAGTPGAGKSYTIKQLAGTISPRVVNTDRFVEFMADKNGHQLKGEAINSFWKANKDKAFHLNRTALRGYLNGMLPLFIDGTSSDINNLMVRSGTLESLGYDVGMIFVNTSFDTAVKRVANRKRDVDHEVIEMAYKLADENKKFYRDKFDFFIEINNDHNELTDEILLEAYRKTARFFAAPVKNPIGRRSLEKLENEKEKELVPTIIKLDELDKKLSTWYVD